MVGRYPCIRPSDHHSLGPEIHVGSHRWPLYCSKWSNLLWGQKWARIGPKMAYNDPKWCQTPLWSLHTRLNPPPMTNYVPIQRSEPWETQHGVCRGPFWTVLPTPKPISGSFRFVIWPHLGLCGSNRNSEATFPMYKQHPILSRFPHLVLSCLGSLSTQLTLVLAYTLPNAHVGHLKMSEDFA